jgi:hypothetical protein
MFVRFVGCTCVREEIEDCLKAPLFHRLDDTIDNSLIKCTPAHIYLHRSWKLSPVLPHISSKTAMSLSSKCLHSWSRTSHRTSQC